MRRENEARPWLGGNGRATAGAGDNGHPHFTPDVKEVAVLWPKRGRNCVIGKLVVARPLGRFVFAMPYRNRRGVEHVSIPPAVLAYARAQGASDWIVRFDLRGECLALPLSEVEREGWLATSEGQPEWFVPLTRFQPISWQEWQYVEAAVTLGDEASRPQGKQLVFDAMAVLP